MPRLGYVSSTESDLERLSLVRGAEVWRRALRHGSAGYDSGAATGWGPEVGPVSASCAGGEVSRCLKTQKFHAW